MENHVSHQTPRLPDFIVAEVAAEDEFFTDAYPSVFVADGARTITLWQVAKPASRDCGRRLSHTAFKVCASEFSSLFDVVTSWPNVEFDGGKPLCLGAGASHFRIRMPDGQSIEFQASPKAV